MPNISKKLKSLTVTRKILIGVVLVVFLLGALAFTFRSLFLVAVVNNTPITRYSLDRELEKQAGKQALEIKVVEILINQEATKQKVQVSTSEIDNRIKDLENQVSSQGQNLDSLLQLRGMTRQDLQNQVKNQIIVEKIVGKDLQVTDDEIKTYFEANKQYLPKGATLESQKDTIKENIFQRKLQEKTDSWITNLKQQAKIYYFLKL